MMEKEGKGWIREALKGIFIQVDGFFYLYNLRSSDGVEIRMEFIFGRFNGKSTTPTADIGLASC